MPGFDTSCMIFIDYDNLTSIQKMAGLLDVVTKVLFQMSFGIDATRIECEVRVYGGWYEDVSITTLAQNVTIEIQNDFPNNIRLPNPGSAQIVAFIKAELAVALLEEPSHHLFNTYRRKGKPTNVRVMNPEDVGCEDDACIIMSLKKFIKKGKCPKLGCEVGQADLIYRHEQKIVDTMLTCDIIYAAKHINHIILVSSDDDFLPPLRTVVLQGTNAVRFHTQPNSQRASYPPGGTTLFEKDI